MALDHKPGDVVTILIEGRAYETRFDDVGTQRFPANGVLAYLRRLNAGHGTSRDPQAAVGIDLDAILAQSRVYDLPRRDVAEFLMALGYSVDGLRDMDVCTGWRFVNPAWGRDAEDPAEPEEGAQPPMVVDGVSFETFLDEDGTRRFRGNAVIRLIADMRDPRAVDLNELCIACERDSFTLSDYVQFYAWLGYSIDGFHELSMFEGCVIDEFGDGASDPVLPDRSFQATHRSQDTRLDPARQHMGLSGLGDEVIEASPMREVHFGNLFAYMHRRFGPPSLGGDPFKNLSGSWLLDTPDPDLFVIVSPSLSGAWHSFSPYMSGLLPEHRDHFRHPLPEERVESFRKAYGTLLTDLLRPVRVRDSQFNALGEVGGDDPLMGWDGNEEDDGDDDGRDAYSAPYHETSGYGVPLGVFGTEHWSDLFAAVSYLGGRDLTKGMESLVAIARGRIFADLATKSDNLRLLVAAGCVGPRFQMVLDGLALPEAELALAREVASALLGSGRTDQSDFEMPPFTDEEADEATRILGALGITAPMRKSLRSFHHWARINRTWKAFSAVVGEDFPDAAIPKRFYPSQKETLALPAVLREAGRPDIAEFAEGILAEEDGEHILNTLYLGICSEARKQAHTADGTVASPSPEEPEGDSAQGSE